jgi:rhodanese-related sulfurtransferase
VNFFIDNIFLIGIVLLSGGALFLPAFRQGGNRLSQLQATQMINQGKTVVVDIRAPEEFAAGHLRDAKNLPVKELPQRAGELDKNKEKNVIIVSRNGMDASKAVRSLNKAGFTNVYCLDGGIAAWQAQGLPTTR